MGVSVSLSLQEGVALSLQEEAFFAIERPRVSTEKILNVCGYVPILSLFTGTTRIAIAVVETIQFIVRGSLRLIASLFLQSRSNLTCASRFFYYSAHAVGNIVRGLVEIVPIPYVFFYMSPEYILGGALLHVLSKPVLLYYNYLFPGRFTYPVERVNPSAIKA